MFMRVIGFLTFLYIPSNVGWESKTPIPLIYFDSLYFTQQCLGKFYFLYKRLRICDKEHDMVRQMSRSFLRRCSPSGSQITSMQFPVFHPSRPVESRCSFRGRVSDRLSDGEKSRTWDVIDCRKGRYDDPKKGISKTQLPRLKLQIIDHGRREFQESYSGNFSVSRPNEGTEVSSCSGGVPTPLYYGETRDGNLVV